MKWSIWKFAHATIALLSCHVQNSAAVRHPEMELHYNEFSIEFELRWKKRLWNDPDNKVRGDNMGLIWDRQDPGGPHVEPMNFVIWVRTSGDARNRGDASHGINSILRKYRDLHITAMKSHNAIFKILFHGHGWSTLYLTIEKCRASWTPAIV